MSEQLALLPEYLSAHLRLTLSALLAGTLIAVPAGILVSRWRRLEGPVLGLAGVIQTIPALALLAVMVPLLSGLGLPGIGPLPAFLALVLYSLLPILRNTVAGLHGIDPAVIEAARGVGMTGGQRLVQVELPLALPVILAGIRTATVWTVGMATLSTPVGAASLGNYIFGGLQTRNSAAILTGCVAAATLALVLDGLVRSIGLALGARRRGALVAALALLAASAPGPGLPAGRGAAPRRRAVVVGAKTFTEQYVLAEILAETVRAEHGPRGPDARRRSARPWPSTPCAATRSTSTSTTPARCGRRSWGEAGRAGPAARGRWTRCAAGWRRSTGSPSSPRSASRTRTASRCAARRPTGSG